MSQILVSKEKHGTYYYPASTTEELGKSALALLTERFNQGYWYLTPDEMYNDDSQWEKNALTKLVPEYNPEDDLETRQAALDKWHAENVAPIKDEDARKLVAEKLSKAIKRQKQKRAYQEWYTELERVVKEKDAPKAWGILRDRSDHEYEYVTLEDLQEV